MIQIYAKVKKNISKFMNYKTVSQTCFNMNADMKNLNKKNA